MIKTAIIGASGVIGGHLIKKYKSKYPDCIGTSFSSDKTNISNKSVFIIKELKINQPNHYQF